MAEVVARILDVRNRLAEAAVTATRVGADAGQADRQYREAARGTDHPQLQEALTDIRMASEKAAKTARLLTEAQTHLTRYLNKIAPGTAPEQDVHESEMPSGERLVSEAERRGRKADILWRKQVRNAGDTEDTLKQVEDGGKAVFNFFRQQPSPPGTTSTGTVAPKPDQQHGRPQVDNPVTAVVMATGAIAVAAKSVWNYARARRARKRNDDDQT